MVDEPKLPPQLEETADARPYEPPKRASRLAVAAILCAFSSPLVFILPVWVVGSFGMDHLAVLAGAGLAATGVVLGFLALHAIRKSGFRLAGWRRSIVGIIAGIVFAVLLGAGYYPVSQFMEFAWSESCKGCMLEIVYSCRQYADDHDGAFPVDPGALCPKTLHPRNFSCGSNPSRWREIEKSHALTVQNSSYVYVSGLRTSDPTDCLLLYERQAHRRYRPRRFGWLAGGGAVLLSDAELQANLASTREAVRQRGGEIRLVGE